MPSVTVTTDDAYTPAAEVRSHIPAPRCTINVLGGEILAQFAIADQGDLQARAYDFNTDEKPMTGGVWTWDANDFHGFPIVGVRVRSAAPANPISVTIHL